MKTITLQQAFQILENCAAVITDTHVVTYPSLADLSGNDENQWLNISWSEDGQDYSIICVEENNREIKVSGSAMFLFDGEGEEFQITILVQQNLENIQESFAVGDNVNVIAKRGDIFHDFTGHIKEINGEYIVVEDQDGDCQSCDIDQIEYSSDDIMHD